MTWWGLETKLCTAEADSNHLLTCQWYCWQQTLLTNLPGRPRLPGFCAGLAEALDPVCPEQTLDGFLARRRLHCEQPLS